MGQKRALVVLILLSLLIVLSFSRPEKRATHAYAFPTLSYFPEMPVAKNNPVTVEGVALGRHLFYDTELSHKRNLSCGSCHRQEAAFSDGPNAFSTGHNGQLLTRNTLPLFNLAWYQTLFWDGRAISIEDQVFHPVRAHTEMNLQWNEVVKRINSKARYKEMFIAAFGDDVVDSIRIANAIAQFERTLISYNSKYDQVLAGKTLFTKEEYEGFELANDMAKGDCLQCHSTDADALGTMVGFSNNGLDDATKVEDFKDKGRGAYTGKAADIGKFKIPSLRNIGLTGPYMHDGRFKSLEEVLNFYSEGVKQGLNLDVKMEYAHVGGVHLSKDEQRKIILFLHTLSDSVFIRNMEYSNPFLKRH